jgi:hypothetical protein
VKERKIENMTEEERLERETDNETHTHTGREGVRGKVTEKMTEEER